MKRIVYSIILSFGLFVCCEKNGEEVQELKLGDLYEGGIIFNMAGGVGLICSIEDLTPCAFNYGSFSTIYSNDNGKSNTESLVSNYNSPAAISCAEYEVGIYDDWYLPSWIELGILHSHKNYIGEYNTEIAYWSSTARPFFGSAHVCGIFFADGSESCDFGDGCCGAVRPIRQFTYKIK